MSPEEVNKLEEEQAEDEELDDVDPDSVVDLHDDEELDDDVSDETDGDDSDDAELAEPAAMAAEDDDSDEASLDELLDQRSASRRGSDEAEDDDDILGLSSAVARGEPAAAVKASPIKDRAEFVCNRCHLLKAKVQLADPARGLCRDCV